METSKNLKKILGGVLIGGILLSLGGMALADTTSTSSSTSTAKQGVFAKFGFGKGMGGMKGMKQGGFNAAKMQEKLKTNLATLVKAGTITQAKADKVVATFAQHLAQRTADFEKTKTMTAEERQAYMEKMRSERKDPIAQLVTDGVITQTEADAIAKAMPMGGRGHGFGGKGRGPARFSEN